METLAKKLVDRMVTAQVIDSERKDYYAYGATLLLTSFFITILMVASGLVSGCIISVVAYCAAYWGLHSVGDTYHCKKYNRCFLLTMGIFGLMLTSNLLITGENLIPMSGMLLALYAGVILAVYMNSGEKPSRKMLKRPLVVRMIMFVIALALVLTRYAPLAYPFCFGMVAITVMQERGRSIVV